MATVSRKNIPETRRLIQLCLRATTVAMLLSCVLILISIGMIGEELIFRSRAIRTQGTVIVQQQTTQFASLTPPWDPTIEFQDISGIVHKQQFETPGFARDWPVGTSIEIYYSKADPIKIRSAEPIHGVWFYEIAAGFSALVISSLALGLRRSLRQYDKALAAR